MTVLSKTSDTAYKLSKIDIKNNVCTGKIQIIKTSCWLLEKICDHRKREVYLSNSIQIGTLEIVDRTVRGDSCLFFDFFLNLVLFSQVSIYLKKNP